MDVLRRCGWCCSAQNNKCDHDSLLVDPGTGSVYQTRRSGCNFEPGTRRRTFFADPGARTFLKRLLPRKRTEDPTLEILEAASEIEIPPQVQAIDEKVPVVEDKPSNFKESAIKDAPLQAQFPAVRAPEPKISAAKDKVVVGEAKTVKKTPEVEKNSLAVVPKISQPGITVIRTDSSANVKALEDDPSPLPLVAAISSLDSGKESKQEAKGEEKIMPSPRARRRSKSNSNITINICNDRRNEEEGKPEKQDPMLSKKAATTGSGTPSQGAVEERNTQTTEATTSDATNNENDDGFGIVVGDHASNTGGNGGGLTPILKHHSRYKSVSSIQVSTGNDYQDERAWSWTSTSGESGEDEDVTGTEEEETLSDDETESRLHSQTSSSMCNNCASKWTGMSPETQPLALTRKPPIFPEDIVPPVASHLLQEHFSPEAVNMSQQRPPPPIPNPYGGGSPLSFPTVPQLQNPQVFTAQNPAPFTGGPPVPQAMWRMPEPHRMMMMPNYRSGFPPTSPPQNLIRHPGRFAGWQEVPLPTPMMMQPPSPPRLAAPRPPRPPFIFAVAQPQLPLSVSRVPAPHPPHTHPLPTYLTEQELGEVEENADSEEEDEDDSQWEDATSITSAYTVSSEEAATDAVASAGSELASSA